MADVDASLFINFDDLDLKLVADLDNILNILHAMFCKL